MRFGPVPVASSAGAILAYAVQVKGGRLRKGHVLTSADVAALQDSGYETVTVARLGADDLAEDEAAAQLAQALAGDGVRISRAATGRVNLYATGPGIMRVDVPAVHAFNAVNPMITVATLPPWQRVVAGALVATIKIIAFGVPQPDVARACALAPSALGVLPPVYQTATLIETQTDAPLSQKGRNALRVRLERLGLTLDDRVIVPHAVAPLADALKAAQGEVCFILTASATSDALDTGPEGLRGAGGVLTQFGMPVDPGNLLFLGRLGARPVIGLPGCARSPALNGADWVLERVICGLDLTPADFAAMGVGGVLKEIPSRPKPRGDIA